MAWILVLLFGLFTFFAAINGERGATAVGLLVFLPMFGFAFFRTLIRWAGRQWRGTR